MRNTQRIKKIAFLFSMLFSTTALADEPNLPTTAQVEIKRNVFRLKFQWSRSKPPNFKPGTAVEFQINIDPKCFAQPIGGKDDNSKIDVYPNNVRFKKNFPDNSKPYIDVWNYWIPESHQDFTLRAEDACGSLGLINLSLTWDLWWFIKRKYTETKSANFAIGLKDASALNTDWEKKAADTENPMYFFEYPLEIPLTPECLDEKKEAWSGGAWVSMQYFPNTCHLANISPYTCPEFLGVKYCTEDNGKTVQWIQRLCAPSNLFTFTPGGSKELMPWGNDQCHDSDRDNVASIQSRPMLGTNVGDCDDQNPFIRNQRYNIETNQCLPEPITACTGKDPGLYCGSTLPGYTGNSTDLVYCKDDIVQMQGGRSCMHGCQVQPPGIDDYCKPPPNPCGAPCTPPLVCSTSGCVARCGEQNQPCCEPGQTCDILGEKSFCDSRSNFSCRPCGKTDQACCPGANPCYSATYGLSVYCDKAANMCWPCGDRGQRCCKVGQQCVLGATCVLDAPPDDYRCR